MLQLIIISIATFGLFGLLAYVEKRSDDRIGSTRSGRLWTSLFCSILYFNQASRWFEN
jgi:hypothetical protein